MVASLMEMWAVMVFVWLVVQMMRNMRWLVVWWLVVLVELV